MKIVSWNVNGVRAVYRKGIFPSFLENWRPDILCLQETKVSEDQVPLEISDVKGYTSCWSSGERKGYSGVATFHSAEPGSVCSGFRMDPRFDREGRILVSEFPDFTLLNIYFPNGQKDDKRLRYKLDFYNATLEYCESRRKEGKSLIICGDYNTAHNEIDLARPDDNRNVSGFLRIERDWMDKWEARGYVDTFRALHSETGDAYTWWSYRTKARERNVGWRLDYFYVTPELMPKVKSSEMISEVTGSDHCPIILDLGASFKTPREPPW